jgi:hypothetical protein
MIQTAHYGWAGLLTYSAQAQLILFNRLIIHVDYSWNYPRKTEVSRCFYVKPLQFNCVNIVERLAHGESRTSSNAYRSY